jgi:branched-chain amino acid transport system permease protein
MTHLLQVISDGLGTGAGYVLVALGFSMMFGVLGVLNVAQADFCMVGAYVGYVVLTALGANFLLGVGSALVSGVAVGILFYAIVVKRVRQEQQLAVFVATLGLSLFLQNFVARLAGPDQRPFPQLVGLGYYNIGGVIWPRQEVVLVAVTLVLAALVMAWLRYSAVGRDTRAVAENRLVAAAVGINVQRTMAIAVIVASVLATVGGVVIGNSLSTITPFIGSTLALKMFIVVLVAGAGSIKGAVAVGFGLGVAESLTVAYISSQWQDMTGLVALVAVLLLRPEGVFGQRARIG